LDNPEREKMVSIYDLDNNAVAVVEYVFDFRAEEMGLLKGVEVQILQSGNPCIVKLNGFTKRIYSKLCIGHIDVLVSQ